MKRLLIYSLLTLLSTSTLVAQNQKGEPVIDFEGVTLYGNVKSAKISIYALKPEGNKTVEDLYAIHNFKLFKSGVVEEQAGYNSEGTLCYKVLNKVNEQGKLVESVEIDYQANPATQRKKCYEYGSNGKMSTCVLYDTDGSIVWKDVYKYDQKDNKVETIVYDGANALKYRIVIDYLEGGKQAFSASYLADNTIEWKSYVRYNSNGQRSEELSYDGEGKPEWRNVLEYDSNGNLTSVVKYNMAGEVINSRISKYDKNNNVVEDSWSHKSEDTPSRVLYKYDSKGNVIEHLLYYGGDAPLVKMKVEISYYE